MSRELSVEQTRELMNKAETVPPKDNVKHTGHFRLLLYVAKATWKPPVFRTLRLARVCTLHRRDSAA
jgi:hypothetical protein